MTLKMVNNFSKKEYIFDAFDIKDSKNFYHFSIRFNQKMDEGEYNYYLIGDDNKILATSLLQIGDYAEEKKTYTNENNGYKQYNG